MGTYIVRRLLLMLLVVWGALTLLFVMFVATPGDTLSIKSGDRQVTASVRRNIERYYGLDKPLINQYGNYWKNFLRGDLGRSYNNDRSVNQMLKSAAKTSARLAFWGLIVQLVFGISIGVLSAVKRYSIIDMVSGFIAVALSAVPVFVTGIVGQWAFGVLPGPNYWNWPKWTRFPTAGFGPDKWYVGVIPAGHTWKYVVLPAFVIAAVQTGFLTRLMRASMLEVLRADYMRTAAAKGLTRRAIIFKHGLRNAMIPVVTVLGADIISMFGVAVLTETVFNLTGLGSTVARAVELKDIPVVLGFISVVVTVTSVVYLLVDIAYGVIDPRIRLSDPGGGNG